MLGNIALDARRGTLSVGNRCIQMFCHGTITHSIFYFGIVLGVKQSHCDFQGALTKLAPLQLTPRVSRTVPAAAAAASPAITRSRRSVASTFLLKG